MSGNWNIEHNPHRFELIDGYSKQLQDYAVTTAPVEIPCTTLCDFWIGAAGGCNNCLNVPPAGWPEGPLVYGNPNVKYCYGNASLAYYEWECF